MALILLATWLYHLDRWWWDHSFGSLLMMMMTRETYDEHVLESQVFILFCLFFFNAKAIVPDTSYMSVSNQIHKNIEMCVWVCVCSFKFCVALSMKLFCASRTFKLKVKSFTVFAQHNVLRNFTDRASIVWHSLWLFFSAFCGLMDKKSKYFDPAFYSKLDWTFSSFNFFLYNLNETQGE